MAEYTPSRLAVRGRYIDGAAFQNRYTSDPDHEAEFDRFLARVRRDAAREALDGLAEQEKESFLKLHTAGAPMAAERCSHAHYAAENYKHTHYPEETP